MRRGELERGIALDVARREIASRLRHVCQNFEEAEFAALVDRMAEIEVRYRLRDDWMMYREALAASVIRRQSSGPHSEGLLMKTTSEQNKKLVLEGFGT